MYIAYKNSDKKVISIRETEEQCRAKKYDISTKERYCFTGRFCRFLGSKDKDYGYKVFIDDNLKEKEINLIIITLLSKTTFTQYDWNQIYRS